LVLDNSRIRASSEEVQELNESASLDQLRVGEQSRLVDDILHLVRLGSDEETLRGDFEGESSRLEISIGNEWNQLFEDGGSSSLELA
jgi:hypothetical protein